MKAKNFDQQFDDGLDITTLLDVSKAKRVQKVLTKQQNHFVQKCN